MGARAGEATVWAGEADIGTGLFVGPVRAADTFPIKQDAVVVTHALVLLQNFIF